MKKVFLFASMLCVVLSSFAREKSLLGTKGAEGGVFRNGVYFNLGFGFPSSKVTSVDGNNVHVGYRYLGFQPSIELGSQWYLYKNDLFGVGLKISWLQVGFSSYSDKPNAYKTNTFDFKFFKFGPQFSLALDERTALDFYVDAAPTLLVMNSKYKHADHTEQALGFGVLIAPGIRFRYKKFAMGFDYGIGQVSGPYTSTNNGHRSNAVTMKQSVLQPRVYVGFKF